MKFEGFIGRVEKLEAEATAGKIATIDESGARVWLEPGGLYLVFRLLWLRDDLGREKLCPDDLPEDLRREASLWSRAEAQSPPDHEVKRICLEVLA